MVLKSWESLGESFWDSPFNCPMFSMGTDLEKRDYDGSAADSASSCAYRQPADS